MRVFVITTQLLLSAALPMLAKKNDVTIKPFLKTQIWNAFSEDDISSYVRRGRMGLGIKLKDSWSLCGSLEFDKLGKDEWAPPKGISEDERIKLWDLYMSWKPFNEKSSLVVTTGYALPQLNQEVVTKPWFIPSLEKSKSSTFLRNFVTGKNSGISPVINIGGILGSDKNWMEYNASIIQAGNHATKSNIRASLVAGRLNIGMGNKPTYSYKKKAIMPSSRNSLMLGVNASYQGKTEDFSKNSTWGIDMVGNLKALKISADFSKMIWFNNMASYSGSTGFVRTSYNQEYAKDKSLEPSITWSAYDFVANDSGLKSGLSSYLDAGLDFYTNKKVVKISFHYTWSANHESNSIQFEDYKQDSIVLALQFILK